MSSTYLHGIGRADALRDRHRILTAHHSIPTIPRLAILDICPNVKVSIAAELNASPELSTFSDYGASRLMPDMRLPAVLDRPSSSLPCIGLLSGQKHEGRRFTVRQGTFNRRRYAWETRVQRVHATSLSGHVRVGSPTCTRRRTFKEDSRRRYAHAA